MTRSALSAQDPAPCGQIGGTGGAQGKTSTSDGPVRVTAPSVVFEREGRRLVAGGWQPLLAYDVIVANLTRPFDVCRLLILRSLFEHFPDGLTTAEVAALLAKGPDPIEDLEGTERLLLDHAAGGEVSRIPLGQDAIWRRVPGRDAEIHPQTVAALA